MPRMGRVVLPDYPHHVVQRGHNRQVVFAGESDFRRYIDDVRELHPVRACMASSPEEYKWSSYHQCVGIETDKWIDYDPCYLALGETIFERCRVYGRYVARGALKGDYL